MCLFGGSPKVPSICPELSFFPAPKLLSQRKVFQHQGIGYFIQTLVGNSIVLYSTPKLDGWSDIWQIHTFFSKWKEKNILHPFLLTNWSREIKQDAGLTGQLLLCKLEIDWKTWPRISSLFTLSRRRRKKTFEWKKNLESFKCEIWQERAAYLVTRDQIFRIFTFSNVSRKMKPSSIFIGNETRFRQSSRFSWGAKKNDPISFDMGWWVGELQILR